MNKKYILIVLLLLSLNAFAQPENNTIETAIPIDIPQGSTCKGGFNFTLPFSTDGTTGDIGAGCIGYRQHSNY